MWHFGIWHGFGLVFWIVVVGVPLWKIVERSGNHPALALLFLVPIVNLGFLWWLAFARWPAVPASPPPQ
jgi:hypothetical protein